MGKLTRRLTDTGRADIPPAPDGARAVVLNMGPDVDDGDRAAFVSARVVWSSVTLTFRTLTGSQRDFWRALWRRARGLGVSVRPVRPDPDAPERCLPELWVDGEDTGPVVSYVLSGIGGPGGPLDVVLILAQTYNGSPLMRADWGRARIMTAGGAGPEKVRPSGKPPRPGKPGKPENGFPWCAKDSASAAAPPVGTPDPAAPAPLWVDHGTDGRTTAIPPRRPKRGRPAPVNPAAGGRDTDTYWQAAADGLQWDGAGI